MHRLFEAILMNLLQSLYDRSPIFVQNFLLSSYSFYITYERYGKEFQSQYKEFLRNPWLAEELLFSYQNERLKKLIDHVYYNVPYYSKIMKERNVRNCIYFDILKRVHREPIYRLG